MQPNPEPMPREPSLEELCRLSGAANVAYAVRCGRRMQPKFAPTHADAAAMTKIVQSSLTWVEMSLRQAMPVDESVQALVEAAGAVAEAMSEANDFAAYAAYHAVRGAVLATTKPAPYEMEDFLEIVAAAFGASRVLLASVPTSLHARAVATLRADFDRLSSLDLGASAERGRQVDVSSHGPLGNLWDDPTPTW